MDQDQLFRQLLYKNVHLDESNADAVDAHDTDVDIYKAYNAALANLDSTVKQEIMQELEGIDLTSLDPEELAELTAIISDAEVGNPSTADLLMQQDFDEVVDNGNDTFLNEKPSGKMRTSNMVRQKHKMGLNALPKSKLKAQRIKNKVKNFKARLKAKKYYKQNKNVLKRYNKSYNAAVASGKHQAAVRRKS